MITGAGQNYGCSTYLQMLRRRLLFLCLSGTLGTWVEQRIQYLAVAPHMVLAGGFTFLYNRFEDHALHGVHDL